MSRVRASEHLIYLHVTLQQLLCCPSYSAAFLALLALAFLSSFSYRISNAYDVERPIDDPSLFFFPYLQRFFFYKRSNPNSANEPDTWIVIATVWSHPVSLLRTSDNTQIEFVTAMLNRSAPATRNSRNGNRRFHVVRNAFMPPMTNHAILCILRGRGLAVGWQPLSVLGIGGHLRFTYSTRTSITCLMSRNRYLIVKLNLSLGCRSLSMRHQSLHSSYTIVSILRPILVRHTT